MAINQPRMIAYSLATEIDPHTFTQISGGTMQGTRSGTLRVTGDVLNPDVRVDFEDD